MQLKNQTKNQYKMPAGINIKYNSQKKSNLKNKILETRHEQPHTNT